MKIKIALGFAAGFIFGGALGAFIMKDKYKEESDAAIQNIRDYYKELTKKETEAKEEASEEVVAPHVVDIPKTNDTVDYRKYAEKVEEYVDIPPAEASSDIEIITEDDYDETFPHFEKEELHYYSMNDVLTDIDNEVIVDKEKMVGKNLYKRFQSQGGYDNFIDEIFMRNHSLGEDYRIIHEPGKFITEFE
jgi:hypothetical protein